MSADILVIDQGTTSTRAMLFDAELAVRAQVQREFPQIYPHSGWVEHDPEAIWSSVLETAQGVMAGRDPAGIAAIGLTNQRETVVIWDRVTGRAIANAIVWQDRRTAGHCARLEAEGHAALVTQRTGLRLDPYFSATKIAWLLDHVPGARAQAEAGRLAFGTVDCFLLWRLTEGRVHSTDATNASRTLLCDIATGAWDDDLLRLFDIPRALLPEIRDCAGDFGSTTLFGGQIAVRGIAGDQQAALIGQACFKPGMVKATYGTGAFILLATGGAQVPSRHRMLTTIAWQLHGRRGYALEGAIFSAGTGVQWLRDGLGMIETAAETGSLAAAADPDQHVYLVPAFTGLGAPHWNSAARAALTGISRGTTRREIARAALEAVAYQTRDLLGAMWADAGMTDGAGTVLRVDGGMTASDWTMQFLADMLDQPVERPGCLETTSVGVAYLAGLGAGICPEPAVFQERWTSERRFDPKMAPELRNQKYTGWQEALAQVLK